MKEILSNSLKLFQFTNLSSQKSVAHYVSGRNGGISSNALGGLNLSFRVGDERENVIENRLRLATAMDVNYRNLIFPSQTHSVNVKYVGENTDESVLEDTDALITNIPGKLISVMSADCVPILLYDARNNAVGAVHAGWRGSVGRILEKTIAAMKDKFGTNPEDILAGIGPSICKQVYEVGDEVIEEVINAFGNKGNLIDRKEGASKGFIDLWEINKTQLTNLGVKHSSIEVAGICTYTHSDEFFSARKSGNKAGRFAAGIMVKG